MKNLLLSLLMVAALSAPSAAQFTIPNNNSGSIVSTDQSVWMQTDIDALVAGIGQVGVLYGAAVTQQGTPAMGVAVATGMVRVNGKLVSVSSGNVTVTTADVTNPRIDLVSVNSSGTKTVTAGTAATSPAPPSIPSNSVLLAMVYVPANATSILNANIVDKRVMLDKESDNIVDVSDYGAKCDASTDDTTAIQNAFNAAEALVTATVTFPAGTCVVSSTLTLGSTVAGTDRYLSLRGQSPASSILRWTGSTSGTLLKVSRVKYSRVENLAFINYVSVGTTVGIEQGGNSTSYGGTQTLAQTYANIIVYGFGTGIRAGGSNAASSEILYLNVELDNNTDGWLGYDLNTLDHVFIELLCSSNTNCLRAGAASNFAVFGGSASNTTGADFKIDQTGTYTIEGFRSEGANRVLDGTASAYVSIKGLLAVSPSNADKVAIAGTYNSLEVQDSTIDGKINVASANTGISIRHTKVFSGSTSLPFTTTSTGSRLPYIVENVYFHDPAASISDFLYPDKTGNIAYTDNGTVFTPNYNNAVEYPVSQVIRGANYIGDALQLNRVKMLAMGTTVDGRNLREEVAFATSSTATVNFVRNVTVSIDAPKLIATSGRFYPSDVGKKVIMVGINSGADEVRFIRHYIDSTHVMVAPLSSAMGCCSVQTGVTATIGENEPDANYMLMLACDANETVRWGSKTSSGFTLTSSNASSTATCDVMIVR